MTADSSSSDQPWGLLERMRDWLREYQARIAPWLRVVIAFAWAGLIWYLSSRPGVPKPPNVFRDHLWNLGHVVIFGVLAGLILLSTQGCTRTRGAMAILLSVSYGAVDEFHQGHVPGRDMSVWDVCSDGLGACIGTVALVWLLAGDRGAGRSLFLFVPLALVSVHMASR